MRPDPIRNISDKLAASELEICRARSKVYARVSRYDSLFEGENYDVDLKLARFSGLMNEEVVSTGPLQIAGTWHQSEFLWSWHNKSIPNQSYSEVKNFCNANELIAPIAGQRAIRCDQKFSELLCQWIAVEMGYVGAFEAPERKAIAYLILSLSVGSTYEPGTSIWCSFCGRTVQQCKHLFTAAPTCAICDVCVRDYRAIFSEQESGYGDTSALEQSMPPCLICGDKTRRIFTEYGAACYDCITLPVLDVAI